MTEEDWKRKFAACGAFWEHDGNPERPYARLTSGLISNGFFNGGRVAEEDPNSFSLAARIMLFDFQHKLRTSRDLGVETVYPRVIGAEYGGIALSVLIAASGSYKSAFAQKQPDGDLAFLRADIKSGERFLMVEDTITTGGTILKLMDAIKRLNLEHAEFCPVVYAICNRSGSGVLGDYPIVSLIRPNFKTWKEGENPFTPNGQELVAPVRPKTDWHTLTRPFD